ncbi:signal peptide peptidase [Moraxella macacae 0408225]|uniref:Signal peptide peptidase n=1 Tax=Moraxella macacae 0408225 TaxID=1230338 RepID=L2F8G8_9GAMM|nr:signal peptide peptidase SppA [Moraxella macacae]ELA08763.1 signal peptide peptidase [Moraxella macacae 0408225]
MSDNWPPNPDKPTHSQQNPSQIPPQYVGKEWQLLEKTLMASIEEQRRARRWSVFFKLLTFGYVILIGVIMTRGCSPAAGTKGKMSIAEAEPHLAVVDIKGAIASGNEANSRDINEALSDAFENENAKAVVVRINSPGGSPVQSDEIFQAMNELRKENPDKKLYAVIEDIGASGAYYIAVGADEIWVNPSSLVGSIGVIMPNYDLQKLMEKVGVSDRTMHSGEYKDILSMTRATTAFEQAHVQSVLDNTHKHFIDAVKQGRGNRLKDPEGNKLFSGLFWSGEQAVQLGLADKTGSLSKLEKELKLDKAVLYNPKDPVQEIFGRFGLQLGSGIGGSFANQLNLKLQNDSKQLQ